MNGCINCNNALTATFRFLVPLKLGNRYCKNWCMSMQWLVFVGSVLAIHLICKIILDEVQDKNPKDLEGSTPLHQAANIGHLEVCKFLSLNLKEKNPRDEMGNTPLHFAAKSGHLDVSKLLCSYLEDKNPMNNYGRTPLDNASSSKHWKIVHFLIVENNLNWSKICQENVFDIVLSFFVTLTPLKSVFFKIILQLKKNKVFQI